MMELSELCQFIRDNNVYSMYLAGSHYINVIIHEMDYVSRLETGK